VTPEAPTTADLENHPVVQAAFGAAWADSLVDDAVLRHEEGGFISSWQPTTRTRSLGPRVAIPTLARTIETVRTTLGFRGL
jgi:hypothetical protein